MSAFQKLLDIHIGRGTMVMGAATTHSDRSPRPPARAAMPWLEAGGWRMEDGGWRLELRRMKIRICRAPFDYTQILAPLASSPVSRHRATVIILFCPIFKWAKLFENGLRIRFKAFIDSLNPVGWGRTGRGGCTFG